MKITAKKIVLKNRMPVILRSASPVDAENILQHLRITHAEAYVNMNQSAAYWQKFSVAEEGKILTEFELAQNKFMLIAVSGQKIVGALSFVGNQAEFTKHSGLLGMSIQNAFCNQGLGTAMMTGALSLVKNMGIHRVELTVRTYNTAAIALYEKVGFTRIGLLKDAAFIDSKYRDEYSYQIIL